MNNEQFKEALENVTSHLLKLADEERQKDDKYKDLFESATDVNFESALRKTHNEMFRIVLNLTSVIEAKTGKKVNNDLFYVLCSLPYVEMILSDDIRDKDGLSCCVDKAYYLLNKFVLENLK